MRKLIRIILMGVVCLTTVIWSRVLIVNASEMLDSIDEVYQFSYSPETDSWKSFSTTEEMINASQVPEEVLKRMTTESLIKTILSNSFLTQFRYYNNSITAIETHINNFNIYQELQTRADYLEKLIQAYGQVSIITESDVKNDELVHKDFYDATYLEILIAAELYNMELSKNNTNITTSVKKHLSEKQELRDSTKLYSSMSNGFIWFERGLTTIEQVNTAEKSLLATVTIRTPNNTAVEAYCLNEFSDAEIRNMDDEADSMYPAATRIASASQRYNCHSYAWYSQNTSTNSYWIDDPSAYWEDGSYVQSSLAVNRKVRYLSGLYTHAPSYGPAYGYSSGVRYYQ